MATILLADDERNIRATVGRSLRMEGHAVVEAADGEEALRRIEAGEADAVLLDLQMPRMDGLEVLERMHEAGSRVAMVVDGAKFIRSSISAVQEDMILGGVLAVVVVLIFLRNQPVRRESSFWPTEA